MYHPLNWPMVSYGRLSTIEKDPNICYVHLSRWFVRFSREVFISRECLPTVFVLMVSLWYITCGWSL